MDKFYPRPVIHCIISTARLYKPEIWNFSLKIKLPTFSEITQVCQYVIVLIWSDEFTYCISTFHCVQYLDFIFLQCSKPEIWTPNPEC